MGNGRGSERGSGRAREAETGGGQLSFGLALVVSSPDSPETPAASVTEVSVTKVTVAKTIAKTTVPSAPLSVPATSPADGPAPVTAPPPVPAPTTTVITTAVSTTIATSSSMVAPPAPVSPPKPEEPRIFGVYELVRAARMSLEMRFADVRVEGEISGLRKTSAGHLYFILKDNEAQIDCVLFAREASRLRFKVADGQQVRCRGRLTIYEGRGKFQMSVVAMLPAGAGLLALAFEELKQKLAGEGLFAPDRKRRLPFLPRIVGVVSSPSGAVIRDIVRVAHRRFPARLLLAPAPVQGDGAAPAIVAALRAIARVPRVDVIILARGGGSMEDLWCFNDEALARAIAACPIPVISAVGHETDFTIADFVADVRAPTPSAAAELAVPMMTDIKAEFAVLQRRAVRAVHAELATRRLVIERARRRIGDPRRLVDAQRQALDDLGSRATAALRANLVRQHKALTAAEARLLRAHPQRRIGEQRAQLTALLRRLHAAIDARIATRHRALEGLRGKLESLSPLSVLERGYALARARDGHVITRAAGLAPGDAIAVRFADGEVTTRVEQTDREPSP
ncbi:MAG TPA: exodeoxyribonuclease VII large subunit, partial [Polyangia bacterium]